MKNGDTLIEMQVDYPTVITYSFYNTSNFFTQFEATEQDKDSTSLVTTISSKQTSL